MFLAAPVAAWFVVVFELFVVWSAVVVVVAAAAAAAVVVVVIVVPSPVEAVLAVVVVELSTVEFAVLAESDEQPENQNKFGYNDIRSYSSEYRCDQVWMGLN